jgi:hypothetical protein
LILLGKRAMPLVRAASPAGAVTLKRSKSGVSSSSERSDRPL